MATRQKTVTLYHGTSGVFDGPPTSGNKDITGAGFPSATHDIGLAEFFAGGSRNGRVFAVRMPISAILDLTKAPTKTAKNMRELARQTQEADADGRYQAVAIPGITTGDDFEFRILSRVTPSRWKVRRSKESKENYGPVENVISRINAGEDVGNEEYLVAEQMLEEDLGETRRQVAVSEHDEDLVDFHQNQAKELEKRTLELKELQQRRREIKAQSRGDISTAVAEYKNAEKPNNPGRGTPTTAAEKRVFTDRGNNAYGEPQRAVRTGRGRKGMMS